MYVAEIRLFACNFAPTGWAQCSGQLLAIQPNLALFSLIGTLYGGDGVRIFQLPNLQGATTIAQGTGQGLSTRDVGETGGEIVVTLVSDQIPVHNHLPLAAAGSADIAPATDFWGVVGNIRPEPNFYGKETDKLVAMNPTVISPVGEGFPHNNLMPYQVVNFCISLGGIFPAKN